MPEIDPPAKKERPAGFEEAIFFDCGCNFQGFDAADSLVFEPCENGADCPNYQFFMAECARQGKVVEEISLPAGFLLDPEDGTL